jgi:hypothetical protein
MSTEVNDLNIVFDPVVQFLDRCLFFDVIDFALLQYLLNDVLFLEIVDLLVDLIALQVDHGLAIQEQERGHLLAV